MSFLDFASSAAEKITQTAAKKYKNEKPFDIPEQKNILISGSSFNCGFASAKVLPDDIGKTNYWLAGYRVGNKVTGIIDQTTINVMWLGCKNKGLILVSADLIGFTGYEVNDIRNQLKDFCSKTGCEGIVISCTHTHAGIDTVGYWGRLPATGKNQKYMLMVKAAIKALCYRAYESRKNGKLYSGFVNAPELVRDGREPTFFDDRLSRLRFVPDDGSTETWYLNFCSHPNTLGGDNSKISADYPCYLRRKINETQKVNVLFSVGATAAIDLAHVRTERYDRTVQGGYMLGEKALSINNDKELKPEILFARKYYPIPIENNVHFLMKVFNVVNARAIPFDGPLNCALLSEIDFIRIGDFEILTVPGELFPEVAYKGHYLDKENSATGFGSNINPETLTEICGNEKLVIFGVTNDMTGYILPPNDFILHKTQPYLTSAKDKFDRNHYNETNSIGPKAAYALTDAFRELIENLKSNKLY